MKTFVITVEARNQNEANMIAKGLQNETLRSIAAVFGQLSELDFLEPGDRRRVLDMANEMRSGKGRHYRGPARGRVGIAPGTEGIGPDETVHNVPAKCARRDTRRKPEERARRTSI